jgi:hypothetical protein
MAPSAALKPSNETFAATTRFVSWRFDATRQNAPFQQSRYPQRPFLAIGVQKAVSHRSTTIHVSLTIRNEKGLSFRFRG